MPLKAMLNSIDRDTSTKYEQLAQTHYENFPVARAFIPKSYRTVVATIYAFARTADDIADEGQLQDDYRLSQLQYLRTQLTTPTTPLMIAVSQCRKQYQLPKVHFSNLLTAFEFDVVNHTYPNIHKRLWYCEHSANPIGRLLLALFSAESPENQESADALCTALQLLNFLQDIKSDWQERNRVYLTQRDLNTYQLDLKQLFESHDPTLIQRANELVTLELQRINKLLKKVQPLIKNTKGPLCRQVKLTLACAKTLVKLLERRGGSLWLQPRFRWYHTPWILSKFFRTN